MTIQFNDIKLNQNYQPQFQKHIMKLMDPKNPLSDKELDKLGKEDLMDFLNIPMGMNGFM